MASQSPPSSSGPSLCFSAASSKYHQGEISWDEYLHHILMHYVKGFTTHGEDIGRGSQFGNTALLATDPFAHALWCWQAPEYQVDDISQLKPIFTAYSHNSVSELKSTLAPLGLEKANIFRRALAFLALQDRKLDMLRYIVNDGQQYYDPFISSAFEDRALAVDQAQEPDLYEIVHQSSWMRHVKRRRAEKEAAERRRPGTRIGPSPQEAAEAFKYAVPW